MQNPPYIVCFGEVLWDVYPDGKKLGGAPFNVAAHATQLGLQAHMVSRIGKDALGDEIIEAIKAQNINPEYTGIDQHHETGVVNVWLGENGKPTYDIKQPAAWDYIETNDALLELVKAAEAFVFGSLVCRSEVSKATLFALAKVSRRNICDLNIRQSFFDKTLITSLLQMTDILKINDEEAELLQSMFGIGAEEFYEKLTTMFSIELVIQTLGADGAEVYSHGKLYRTPGVKITVVDTVGSGDSFLAGFISQLLAGNSILESLEFAAAVGALVATKRGAIPRIGEGEIDAMMKK